MDLGDLGGGVPMLIQQTPVAVPGASFDPKTMPVAIENMLSLIQRLAGWMILWSSTVYINLSAGGKHRFWLLEDDIGC